MHKLVATFDASIKSFTAGTQYTNIQEKLQRFAQMVREYYNLFVAWTYIPSINREVETILQKKVIRHPEIHRREAKGNTKENPSAKLPRLKLYLGEISGHIEKYFEARPLYNENSDDEDYDFDDFDEDYISPEGQFRPSYNTNIAAASIGSSGSLYASIGNLTLEDFFSLTHQNLLVLLSIIAKQVGLADIPVPKRYKYSKDGTKTLGAMLVGCSLENDNLRYHYSIPIRYHSLVFDINYNLMTKHITLSASFYGLAYEGQKFYNKRDFDSRLDTISDIIYFMADAGLIFCKKTGS